MKNGIYFQWWAFGDEEPSRRLISMTFLPRIGEEVVIDSIYYIVALVRHFENDAPTVFLDKHPKTR